MMGDYTEFLRIQSQNAENHRRKSNKKIRRTKKKVKRNTQNEYTLRPLETAGLMTKRFNPNQPRDEEGKWTDGPLGGGSTSLADALAALLAEAEDEEDAGPEEPDVDHHEPWASISYGGTQVTPSHVESYGRSSGLTNVVAKESELDAMSEYVAYDRDTLRINQSLRNNEDLSDEDLARNKILDRIAAKASFSRDTDIWRGAVLSSSQLDSLVVGSTITDRGYSSASPSRGTAEFYANQRSTGGNGEQVLFRIKAKRGDSIIPVRNNEFVIPRGTELVVVGRNGTVVEVEYR